MVEAVAVAAGGAAEMTGPAGWRLARWRRFRDAVTPPGVADGAQDRRYRDARIHWLRSRLPTITAMVAFIFLVFIPLDAAFAPERLLPLAMVRVGCAVTLIALGILIHFRGALVSMPFATCLIAAVVYVEVFLTFAIVGPDRDYAFTGQVMLVQTGVWFLGGFTFLVAAVVNAVALAVWLALQYVATGASGFALMQSVVLLGALTVVAGFAAFNIETLFRRNFAANEALAAEKREYESRAMRDGLTGLWNRRAMEERLAAAVAHADPAGRGGAVLMIDLDDFKPINDCHGHHAGDEALIAVARRIQSVLRPGDSVGRIGGDEFLVLAEDVPDRDQARQLAERIRRQVEAPMRVRLHGDSGTVAVQVGASIGVAALEGSTVPPHALIRAADLDMYRDKALRKGP
jgi:diguanylate cyclase (GGDEF)-like protein